MIFSIHFSSISLQASPYLIGLVKIMSIMYGTFIDKPIDNAEKEVAWVGIINNLFIVSYFCLFSYFLRNGIYDIPQNMFV